MYHLIVLAAQTNATWFLFPLAAVVSLVYNASRYEEPETILRRAARLFITIILFLGAVFILLYLLSFRL